MKQIHIPLPYKEACPEIIRIHTIKNGLKLDEQILDDVTERCNEDMFCGKGHGNAVQRCDMEHGCAQRILRSVVLLTSRLMRYERMCLGCVN